VPYEYIANRPIKPPDGLLYDFIAFVALSCTFLSPILIGYSKLLRIIWWRRLVGFGAWLRGRSGGIAFWVNHEILSRVGFRFTNPGPNNNTNNTASTDPIKVYAFTAGLTKQRFAMMAENIDPSYLTSWDTDGLYFCVDNSATCIICNDRSMFIGDLSPSKAEVLTSNGQNVPPQEGTLRLVLEDDTGVQHQYDIPGALYDPESPFNLLGVPFFSKYFGDAETMGTKIESGCHRSNFVWDHGKHERHFTHGIDCLPMLQVNTGQSYFKAFCTRVGRFYNDNIKFSLRAQRRVQFDIRQPQESSAKRRKYYSQDFEYGMELIYKDGQGTNSPVVYEGAVDDGLFHRIRKEDGSTVDVDASHLLMMHQQPDLTNVPSTPLDYQKEVENQYLSLDDAVRLARPQTLTPTQQMLLDWHYRLYHLPFRRILMLAERGWLPRRLLDCRDRIPLCVACQFGAAHRRPWRVKGKRSGKIRKETQTKPGDGQSIDQIVSAQPGLIPQMSGFLTSQRYWGVTVFVDHFSDYIYCHLMRALTLDETLDAKRSWEILLANAGHSAKHYHADNGRFADDDFRAHCDERNQTLDFCGVGAHHQNGVVEGKIRIITEGARTILLHGM
jgi:hypothetical protein